MTEKEIFSKMRVICENVIELHDNAEDKEDNIRCMELERIAYLARIVLAHIDE
jgi:hypothetical protein